MSALANAQETARARHAIVRAKEIRTLRAANVAIAEYAAALVALFATRGVLPCS